MAIAPDDMPAWRRAISGILRRLVADPLHSCTEEKQSMRVLLLLAAIAVPILAAAQPAKIGVLTFEETPEALKQALRSGLREQGYTEGRNITLEWREAGGKVERANQLAAELVSMKVDVIVASLTPAVTAAKKATSTIPIVMAPAADPVATGFVKSLSHPGGNITGITNVVTDVGSKLLGLIRELKPNVNRVGVQIGRAAG